MRPIVQSRRYSGTMSALVFATVLSACGGAVDTSVAPSDAVPVPVAEDAAVVPVIVVPMPTVTGAKCCAAGGDVATCVAGHSWSYGSELTHTCLDGASSLSDRCSLGGVEGVVIDCSAGR